MVENGTTLVLNIAPLVGGGQGYFSLFLFCVSLNVF